MITNPVNGSIRDRIPTSRQASGPSLRTVGQPGNGSRQRSGCHWFAHLSGQHVHRRLQPSSTLEFMPHPRCRHNRRATDRSRVDSQRNAHDRVLRRRSSRRPPRPNYSPRLCPPDLPLRWSSNWHRAGPERGTSGTLGLRTCQPAKPHQVRNHLGGRPVRVSSLRPCVCWATRICKIIDRRSS